MGYFQKRFSIKTAEETELLMLGISPLSLLLLKWSFMYHEKETAQAKSVCIKVGPYSFFENYVENVFRKER